MIDSLNVKRVNNSFCAIEKRPYRVTFYIEVMSNEIQVFFFILVPCQNGNGALNFSQS